MQERFNSGLCAGASPAGKVSTSCGAKRSADSGGPKPSKPNYLLAKYLEYFGSKSFQNLEPKKKELATLALRAACKNLRDYPQKVNNGNDAIVGCIKGIAGTRAELVRD